MNKKILTAIACVALLAVASLSACSNDHGTGTSINSSDSIITMPESFQATDKE